MQRSNISITIVHHAKPASQFRYLRKLLRIQQLASGRFDGLCLTKKWNGCSTRNNDQTPSLDVRGRCNYVMVLPIPTLLTTQQESAPRARVNTDLDARDSRDVIPATADGCISSARRPADRTVGASVGGNGNSGDSNASIIGPQRLLVRAAPSR